MLWFSSMNLEQVSMPLTVTGSGVAAVSGASHWLVAHAQVFSVLGVLAGIAMAGAGIFFQYRRDRRESALHEKRMSERWGNGK